MIQLIYRGDWKTQQQNKLIVHGQLLTGLLQSIPQILPLPHKNPVIFGSSQLFSFIILFYYLSLIRMILHEYY